MIKIKHLILKEMTQLSKRGKASETYKHINIINQTKTEIGEAAIRKELGRHGEIVAFNRQGLHVQIRHAKP